MLTRLNISYIVHLLLISYFHYVPTVAQKEGVPCQHTDGSKGECKLIGRCPSAVALLEKGIDPEELNPTCGHIGTKSLVCCEGTPSETPLEPTSVPEPKLVKTVEYTNRKAGEISKRKCKEYAKYVVDKKITPILSIDRTYDETNKCVFAKQTLIVGGEPATEQEFPHMALIGYKTGSEVEWGCGGSLISEQFILTAAHCLNDPGKGTAKLVKVGILRRTDTAHLQQVAVSEIIYYPDYNYTKYHDIGLLKLSKSITLNTYSRPACLQTEKNIPYQKAIVSGWGTIRSTMTSGVNDLLKANLHFFDPKTCNASYNGTIYKKKSPLKNGIVDDLMLCAGSHTEIKDTCKGDSGGPLQVYHDDKKDNIQCMYDIVGVTSFGISCGLAKNLPGIYTRVSAYVKWIEDVVWPE